VSTEEKYVAAVYLVVFLVLLAYVFIIALKLQRLEREVADLVEVARRGGRESARPRAARTGGGGLGEPEGFPTYQEMRRG
jgi:CcmD family protein